MDSNPSTITRVLFMGSKQLGLHILETMHSLAPQSIAGVLTIDDRDDCRSRLAEITSFCNAHSLEVRVARSRHDAEQSIADLKVELCIVVGWYWLIPAATLRQVPYGFIGLHNSLLPRYRGGSPLVWSIIDGGRHTGFSFFSLTEGLDDGPIWAQEAVTVGRDDFVGDILRRIETRATRVFSDIYPDVLANRIRPSPQGTRSVSYCAIRLPKDGRIDWHAPARSVYNFIRAQSAPYPGAFTYCDRSRLIIWHAAEFGEKYHGQPGQVARVTPEGVFVVCGDNRAIVLTQVESNGVRGPAAQAIGSTTLRMGDHSAIEEKSA